MAQIPCACNASMERFFAIGKNLSDNPNFNIYYTLLDAGTRNEQRILWVENSHSGDILLLVRLNQNGGLKPTNGLTAQYMPHINPNPRLNVRCDALFERVVYADINLTDESGLEIKYNIITDTSTADKRHFLSFKSTNRSLPPELEGEEIDVNDDASKKPLGGGLRLRLI
jgi:hypothetical protein